MYTYTYERYTYFPIWNIRYDSVDFIVYVLYVVYVVFASFCKRQLKVKSIKIYSGSTLFLIILQFRDTWLGQLVEHTTLNLGVVNSSPIWV